MLARLSIAILVVLLVASAARARGPAAAPDCSTNPCAFMPVVLKAQEPTATPTAEPTATPESIPTPEAPCDQNAPSPAEGAQAWMTVTSPAHFSNTTVCVRLIQGGQVVSGVTMSATAHYKTKDTDLGTAVSGSDGVARITFSIGGASSGFTVVVDGTIDGQPFSTSFTPQ